MYTFTIPTFTPRMLTSVEGWLYCGLEKILKTEEYNAVRKSRLTALINHVLSTEQTWSRDSQSNFLYLSVRIYLERN